MISDIAGNLVQQILNGNALLVQSYGNDTINPTVIGFNLLDLNNGEMRIEFDEPILPEDVQFSGITLISDTASINLSDGIVTSFNELSTVLSIEFSTEDLTQIKLDQNLRNGILDITLSVAESAFSDPANNTVIAINQSLLGSNFRSDFTKPTLLDYELDLDEGLLILTFNDVMNLNSFNPMFITLQNQPGENVPSFALTGGIPQTDDNFIIEVMLTLNDINDIKQDSLLAVSESTTYLSIRGQAISDISGNTVDEIVPNFARIALNFTQDQTPPVLSEFIIDLNAGYIMFLFTETVNITSFSAGEVVLQNTSVGNSSTGELRLSDGGRSDPSVADNSFCSLPY